jgi:hypothetical protein
VVGAQVQPLEGTVAACGRGTGAVVGGGGGEHVQYSVAAGA